jgi:hypothetical protein
MPSVLVVHTPFLSMTMVFPLESVSFCVSIE